MIWIALVPAALLASVTVQAGAAAPGESFSAAELRVMCRGETAGTAQFRTQQAYALMAEFQRSKCAMYLLGVADGIGRRQATGRDCPAASAQRNALGNLLAEAILQPPTNPERSVREIVESVLRSYRAC